MPKLVKNLKAAMKEKNLHHNRLKDLTVFQNHPKSLILNWILDLPEKDLKGPRKDLKKSFKMTQKEVLKRNFKEPNRT